MFFTSKAKKEFVDMQREKENLDRDIKNMTATISSYERQIAEKKTYLKELTGKIESSLSDELKKSNFSFDFKRMNAFSVERIKRKDDKFPITVVGYVHNNEVREWFFYCSLDAHDSLVEEFNLWKMV